MMASIPEGDNEHTIMETPDGWGLYRSRTTPPASAPSFCNNAKQRILASTRLPLRVAVPQESRFWTNVENACRIFAWAAQREMQHRPSADNISKAHNLAKRLRAELPFVFEQQQPPEFEQIFSQILEMFITRTHSDYEQSRLDALYQNRNTNKRKVVRPICNSNLSPTKPKLWAGRELIHTMGSIYRRAFDRVPAATEDGPFTRFVLACLAETTGLPHEATPSWVKKYVSEHINIAKQRGNNSWALDEPGAWDDPP